MSIRAGTKCVVNGCHSRVDYDSELTFHRLPVHRPELLSKWLKAVNRPDLVPNRSMVICGNHFAPDLFQIRAGRKILKPNASPKITTSTHIIVTKQKANIDFENIQASTSLARVFAQEEFEDVSANEEISTDVETSVVESPEPVEISIISTNGSQGKQVVTIPVRKPTVELSPKQGSPSVSLIHSYAQSTDDRDELQDAVVELETQNRQLREQLKLEKERNTKLCRSSEMLKDVEDITQDSKKMEMSIVYIQF